MQSRAGTSGAAIANGAANARGAQAGVADQTRVLYAGEMEFARSQFASEAPSLQLLPLADALAQASDGARFAAGQADVVFIDCGSARVNAAALVEEMRARNVAVPIVLAIDPGVESSAKTALDLRVDDYTIKSPGWLARLPARLGVSIARHRQLDLVNAREQRLRSMLDGAPVCLARLGRDGHILAMNDAARALVGAEQLATVLGKPLSAFVAAEHIEALQHYVESVCDGRPSSIELSLTGLSGTHRIVEVSGVGLPLDGAGRSTALLVFRDITDRRRLELSIAEQASNDESEQRLAEAAIKQAELERDLAAERERAESLVARLRDLEVAQQAAAVEPPQTETVQRELEALRAQADADVTFERGLREQLEATCRDQQVACARLTEQLAVERSRVESLTARARGIEAEQQNIVAQRSQLEAVRVALQEARAKLAAEIARERGAREQLEATCRDQQIACERLAQQLSTERANAATLTQRLKTVETEHVAAAPRAELDALQAALDDARRRHETDLAQERDLRQQLETTCRDAQASCDRLTEQLSVERAQAEAAAVRIRELQAEHGSASAQRAQLEAQQAELDAARAGLETDLAQERQNREHLEAAARDRQAASDRLAEQLAAEQANAAAIAERLHAIEAELQSAVEQRAQVDALRASLDDARTQIETLQQSHDEARVRFEAEVTRITAERAQAEATAAEQSRAIEAERGAATELRAQIDALQGALEAARHGYDADLAQERAAREEIERAIADKDAVCGRLERERDDLLHREREHLASLAEHQRATEEIARSHTDINERVAANNQRAAAAEAEYMRLTAERAERDGAVTLLRIEIERLLDERRAERLELVRTLQKYDDLEELANHRGRLCADLERTLALARTEFIELSDLARRRGEAIAERLGREIATASADTVVNE